MRASGGCLCGAVRYTIDGDTIFACKCYCTDCHRESGTGHTTSIGIPDDAVTMTGDVRVFAKPGGSGAEVLRFFCPSCGTTLMSRAAAVPGTSIIRVGTLDDSEAIEIKMAIYCASASAWDQPSSQSELFPAMPQF